MCVCVCGWRRVKIAKKKKKKKRNEKVNYKREQKKKERKQSRHRIKALFWTTRSMNNAQFFITVLNSLILTVIFVQKCIVLFWTIVFFQRNIVKHVHSKTTNVVSQCKKLLLKWISFKKNWLHAFNRINWMIL